MISQSSYSRNLRVISGFCLGIITAALHATTYTYSTLAGLVGGYAVVDGTGSAARFKYPLGSAIDASGNIFIADYYGNCIRKVTPAGVVTTFAGSATAGNADGNGTSATFSAPWAVAFDSSGNLFVTDTGYSLIRKITPSGQVTTFAGGNNAYQAYNGTGTAAHFAQPKGIALDPSDNMYIVDPGYSTIRRITPGAVVTTYAGPGWAGSSGTTDGSLTAARFNAPAGICRDSLGNFFVADAFNHTVRKISSSGTVSTLAGMGNVSGTADGTGSSARFYYPNAVTTDAYGNVLVADTYNAVIRSISQTGVVATIGGLSRTTGSANGVGSNARFNYPFGMFQGANGVIAIGDGENFLVRTGSVSGTTQTPVITSAQTATCVANSSFSYSITATNSPTQYDCGINDLPTGLSFNASTGVISGVPTQVQTKNVAISATNSYGSGGAMLTITITGPPPVVTSTGAVTVTVGGSLTYQIVATNSPTDYDFANMPPFNGSYSRSTGYLSGTAVTAGAYNMSVYASNSGGTGSQVVAVTVQSSAAITQQPSNATVNYGQNASLSVVATGYPAPTYQWLKNGSNISGATGSTYTITGAVTADQGSYSVVVTNPVTTVTSSSASLTVNSAAPSITTQPGNTIGNRGDNPSFSVVATGIPNPTYQWQKNGTNVSGATGATFTIYGVQPTDEGTYDVIVTNAIGSAASSTASLTVANVGTDVAPTVALYLTGNSTVALNGSTTFRVMSRDLNGGFVATHVDVTKPDGSTPAFAYFGLTGADTRDYTFGSGVQGIYLDQTGTYTITAKAADYSLGYERWSSPVSATVVVQSSVSGNTYYISSSIGNDTYPGTSPSVPWASLSKINTLSPGDTALLRYNDCWILSSELTITATGTSAAWLNIGSYPDGGSNLPVISRGSTLNPPSATCWDFNNSQFVHVSNIAFINASEGIQVWNHQSGTTHYGIEISGCQFTDMNYFAPGGGYAVGIDILTTDGNISNIGINNCTFTRCFTGFNMASHADWAGIATNVASSNCVASYNGGAGAEFYRTSNAILQGWTIQNIGINDSGVPGATGVYLEGSSRVAIIGTTVSTVRHFGVSSDGSGIAIENGPNSVAQVANDYLLVSACNISNTEGPGISWIGQNSGLYNIIENCTFDNVNTLDNTWISLGMPRAAARTTFVSINVKGNEVHGGAFINNTVTNAPTAYGRYSADWVDGSGNTDGFAFTASGFTTSGPSN